jgi:hypothetical protein
MKIEIAGIKFPIKLNLQQAKLEGTIPAELVMGEMRRELDEYDGYKIKDTKYNRWKIKDIDIKSLTKGGVKISLSLNLKKREKIATVFEKTHYTPWVSVTLNGTADFGVAIKENVVDINYRSHNIKGQGWYEDIVEVLANDIFRKEIAKSLEKALSQFDGAEITSFLKKGKLIESKGINLSLRDLLKNTSTSASITSDGVDFVIHLPKELKFT